MSEENIARIREFIDRVLTAGEIEVTGECFHRDMVEEVAFPGQGPEFESGKVHSTRILLDTLGMMQQLGVVPASPDSGSNSKNC
jgi:hypothetical protein